MNASVWMQAVSKGEPLGKLKKAVGDARTGATGIFSSHDVDHSKSQDFIKCLNRLGTELKAAISSKAALIDNARALSHVDNIDMVDVWQFCAELSTVCTHPTLKDMQNALKQVQRERVENGYLQFSKYRGIGVFLPQRTTSAKVNNLPDGFKTAAADWVDFLNAWVGP